MIEAEVHTSLLALLREQGKLNWPHHLTMGRLVARALRLGRSALIQTGTGVVEYSLSYFTPALMCDRPVIIVTPHQQQLLEVEIPQLQQWLNTNKEIRTGNILPESDNFRGIMLTSPQCWLADRIEGEGRFPREIATIIDRADDLEEWTRELQQSSIEPSDWDMLLQTYSRSS